jgi:hypothetical protein
MDIKTGMESGVLRFIALMAVAVLGGMFASRAGAVILNPGQSSAPTGAGTFSGTVIDNETQTFTGGSFLATLHSQVYQQTNGYLDFVYQLTDVAGDSINTLSISSYNDLYLNVDDSLVAGGVAPNQMSRTPLDIASDDTLNFTFSSGLAPGSYSDLLVVQTTATSFYEGSASAIDTIPSNVQAPVPVPEPATAAIAGFALCALGARRRTGAKS